MKDELTYITEPQVVFQPEAYCRAFYNVRSSCNGYCFSYRWQVSLFMSFGLWEISISTLLSACFVSRQGDVQASCWHNWNMLMLKNTQDIISRPLETSSEQFSSRRIYSLRFGDVNLWTMECQLQGCHLTTQTAEWNIYHFSIRTAKERHQLLHLKLNISIREAVVNGRFSHVVQPSA